MSDDLFSIKNEFYLGNYQGAINEAQSPDLVLSSPADERERDIIVYRSYIALGQHEVVESEIGDDAPTALQAVKLLSTYLSKPDAKDIVLMTLLEWLSDSQTLNNPTLQLVAGIIYLDLGELEQAAKVLHSATTLEIVSMQVQVYLRMSRVDIAEKSLSLMSRMEDDATLTQLTTAWVYTALGGEKVQEAFYIFQELADKYNETPLLLNGMAVTQMHLGKFEDADKYLLKALSKSATDVQTLQNLVVCSQHTRKAPEVVSRYINTLSKAAPGCALLKRRAEADAMFDKIAPTFKASAA
ncbi:coatomer subunit epsilon [Guillardia theta CCMP2712]|uniref:Coatomer subunit epsilon n=2 Tax=Guillardia theta TaxID=55529 RepID=L1JSZ8_GUITC|nr:coatomer subunit epsilon [Guillardia theta CCMP2712]EKX51290.1 coatomer subunit epsilon [Guillardia theta CCMP2712]|eukprot:XP_005838270.1 coatomer subunit epsilon [Guillardia theta CCMP2712]